MQLVVQALAQYVSMSLLKFDVRSTQHWRRTKKVSYHIKPFQSWVGPDS